MLANQVQDFSADIRKTYRRFERWRSSHTGRLPIPEPLWAAAAELARDPASWMPWNYRQTLQLAGTGADSSWTLSGRKPSDCGQAQRIPQNVCKTGRSKAKIG
jgi:hypothetical protein